jgi:hypothetical protein
MCTALSRGRVRILTEKREAAMARGADIALYEKYDIIISAVFFVILDIPAITPPTTRH